MPERGTRWSSSGTDNSESSFLAKRSLATSFRRAARTALSPDASARTLAYGMTLPQASCARHYRTYVCDATDQELQLQMSQSTSRCSHIRAHMLTVGLLLTAATVVLLAVSLVALTATPRLLRS